MDISIESQFPHFNKVWKGILFKLKQNGKLGTNHYDTLTDEELEKLYNFMEVLFNLMKLDKKDKDYEYYFAKLPNWPKIRSNN